MELKALGELSTDHACLPQAGSTGSKLFKNLRIEVRIIIELWKQKFTVQTTCFIIRINSPATQGGLPC